MQTSQLIIQTNGMRKKNVLTIQQRYAKAYYNVLPLVPRRAQVEVAQARGQVDTADGDIYNPTLFVYKKLHGYPRGGF